MNKVQFVIIPCWLFGAVHSDSLFGVDFTAPPRVVKAEIGKISQLIKPHQKQHSTVVFGGNNRFFKGNANSDNNEDSINPIPGGIFDRIGPHKTSKINKLNPENSQFSDTRVAFKDDHGPDSEKIPKSISQERNLNTGNGVSKQEPNGYTPGLTETGPDNYTTGALEYEIRIGGPPSAVLASLLGPG